MGHGCVVFRAVLHHVCVRTHGRRLCYEDTVLPAPATKLLNIRKMAGVRLHYARYVAAGLRQDCNLERVRPHDVRRVGAVLGNRGRVLITGLGKRERVADWALRCLQNITDMTTAGLICVGVIGFDLTGDFKTIGNLRR